MAVKGSATITLTQYRDTQSVTRYYILKPAGSSAPSKPTTKPPSSDWTDSEPACDISKELYFCDLTIFSNGEGEYSEVSKSSSYEAAKQAYNKANDASTAAGAAQTAAANAQTTADTAKANAATAQSTADTAKANAATAQSTADTAKTNAATAQSTANTAKANAATAQTAANNAQTAATNAAKTATSYITDINGNSGIKVRTKNNANNHVQVTSNGMSVYQDIDNNAVRVASLGANGVVLGIDKNAQTIVTADGIKIANADGIVGVSVDSSGTSQVATKVVNVYANIAMNGSYTLTLDSSIASGTSLKFKIELDGFPEYSQECTIKVGTNKSETIRGNVNFSYVYNATNKQIKITATEYLVLCYYYYDVTSDLPLVQLNGVLEFNGVQQKDMIIERGTSGIWTYKKYNSGIIECWTTKYWTTPTLTMTAVGNCYKSATVNMPFPSSLFVNVGTYFNVQFSFMSSGTYLQSVMYQNPSNNLLPLVILKGGSSTAACSVCAFAVGRWK